MGLYPVNPACPADLSVAFAKAEARAQAGSFCLSFFSFVLFAPFGGHFSAFNPTDSFVRSVWPVIARPVTRPARSLFAGRLSVISPQLHAARTRRPGARAGWMRDAGIRMAGGSNLLRRRGCIKSQAPHSGHNINLPILSDAFPISAIFLCASFSDRIAHSFLRTVRYSLSRMSA
jgi:hypothetical protein